MKAEYDFSKAKRAKDVPHLAMTFPRKIVFQGGAPEYATPADRSVHS